METAHMSNDTTPDWMTDEHLRRAADSLLGFTPYAREILRLRADLERITAENLEGGAEIRAANEESARLRAELAKLNEHVPTVHRMAQQLADAEAEVERLTQDRNVLLAAAKGVSAINDPFAEGGLAAELRLRQAIEAVEAAGGVTVDLSILPRRECRAVDVAAPICTSSPADLHQPPADLHQFDAAIAEASDYFTEDPQTLAIIAAIKALAREVRRG